MKIFSNPAAAFCIRSAVASTFLITMSGLASGVHAASTFSAHAIGLFQAGGVDDDQVTAAFPVEAHARVDNVRGSINADARASRGFLALEGFVNATGTSRGTSGSLGIFVSVNDVVIRGIDGAPSSEMIAATFQYFTSLDAVFTGPSTATQGLNSADMTANATLVQSGGPTFTRSDVYTRDYFSGPTGTPGLESISGTFQADVPFTLRIDIQSGGLSARGGNTGDYDASINIGPDNGIGIGTRGFANTVFLLPAGFTVDSPELNLFNNQWAGVPEPANAMLLGLLAVAHRRARR